MKVRCLATTGSGINTFTLSNIGDLTKTEYPLKKDEIYTQVLFKNVLHYLIIGTYEDLPSWYPAELFEVVDHQVYLEWYYNYEVNSVVSGLWGYKEMVMTDNHYDDLIERIDGAIEVFF